MKTSNFQKWLMVILLAIGGGTIFKSMYLREVFYYPWNEFMGVNNTDSGLLMSWLGFVGIVSSSIAGVIIDKVNNTRLIISFTFLAVGVTTYGSQQHRVWLRSMSSSAYCLSSQMVFSWYRWCAQPV